MAIHCFLIYTSSYFIILMCIPLIMASWLCRSSVSQPLIVFFHILYSPLLHQTYLHTLVAQPYGYAEAVAALPLHCYKAVLHCFCTALWLCRSSVAQPYSSAMAVQPQPHCCVLYLSPLQLNSLTLVYLRRLSTICFLLPHQILESYSQWYLIPYNTIHLVTLQYYQPPNIVVYSHINPKSGIINLIASNNPLYSTNPYIQYLPHWGLNPLPSPNFILRA